MLRFLTVDPNNNPKKFFYKLATQILRDYNKTIKEWTDKLNTNDHYFSRISPRPNYRTTRNTPQHRLFSQNGFIFSERAIFPSSDQTVPVSLSFYLLPNYPMENVMPTGVPVWNDCSFYTDGVNVFFDCGNPFHCIGFGLDSIFI